MSPDTYVVDEVTADSSSHHKSMLYEWRGGGGDAITPTPDPTYHVHMVFVHVPFSWGQIARYRKPSTPFRRYLGGDGDAGAVLSESLRFCSHMVGYSG